MLHSVTGKEGHRPPVDGSNGEGGRGFSPRRIHLDFVNVLEERVEAGAPEDADAYGLVARGGCQADFSFVVPPDPAPETSFFDSAFDSVFDSAPFAPPAGAESDFSPSPFAPVLAGAFRESVT